MPSLVNRIELLEQKLRGRKGSIEDLIRLADKNLSESDRKILQSLTYDNDLLCLLNKAIK